VFVLLVVLAVLLAVSVVIVLVADRLLGLLRRGPGRHGAAAGGPGPAAARREPPPERPTSEARPTRRRTDPSGPARPASPPAATSRPPAEPPGQTRPEPSPRPTDPVPPAAEPRSRRVQPTPERPDEGAGRWGRSRRGPTPERLHLARIEPSTRQRYAQTFQRTSARFAEEPATALSDADKLVTLLMDERGLPVPVAGADVGGDTPQASLLGEYLAAHAIAEASRSKEVSREELEAGMARYQRLVLALLDDGEGAGAGAAAPRG
jgi:hypothetical protein